MMLIDDIQEYFIFIQILNYIYVWLKYLQKPEEGIWTPGSGITDSCKMPYMVDGPDLRTSERTIYILNSLAPKGLCLCIILFSLYEQDK